MHADETHRQKVIVGLFSQEYHFFLENHGQNRLSTMYVRRIELFVSTNPADPILCADPKTFLVLDDFRAELIFSVRERYVSRSYLLILSLHSTLICVASINI